MTRNKFALGSIGALLVQSFYSIDEFTGLIRRVPTLSTYAELPRPAHIDIVIRSATMATAMSFGLW